MQTLGKDASSDRQIWEKWMQAVPEAIREADGIKAQFAAAVALIACLNAQGGEWTFVPTEVGGWEDRKGIDGYLVNVSSRTHYAVDFSLESAENPRGNKADSNWLVHLRRDWFDKHSDGRWSLKGTCVRALQSAFLLTLRNGPISWSPASTASLFEKRQSK